MESTNKKKVYISGQVTGLDHAKAKWMFSRTAEEINKTEGLIAVNPLYGEEAGQTWEWYMKKDIKLLMDCDLICMMPNWEISRGARVEKSLAEILGIGTHTMDFTFLEEGE